MLVGTLDVTSHDPLPALLALLVCLDPLIHLGVRFLCEEKARQDLDLGFPDALPRGGHPLDENPADAVDAALPAAPQGPFPSDARVVSVRSLALSPLSRDSVVVLPNRRPYLGLADLLSEALDGDPQRREHVPLAVQQVLLTVPGLLLHVNFQLPSPPLQPSAIPPTEPTLPTVFDTKFS